MEHKDSEHITFILPTRIVGLLSLTWDFNNLSQDDIRDVIFMIMLHTTPSFLDVLLWCLSFPFLVF